MLPSTVRSVVLQSLSSIEIVVVDDASVDATPELLVRMQATDGRIRAIRLDRNGGQGEARNRGARESTGEYLQFLDDDDLLHPEKLRVQSDCLDSEADTEISVCQTLHFAMHPGDLPFVWNTARRGLDHLSRFVRHDHLWGTEAPLWRRDAFFSIGEWPITNDAVNDYELHVRALASGLRAGFRNMPLCHHRTHAESRVSRAGPNDVVSRHLAAFRRSEAILRERGLDTGAYLDEIRQNRLWIAMWSLELGVPSIAREAAESALELTTDAGELAATARIIEIAESAAPDVPLKLDSDDPAVLALRCDRQARQGWWLKCPIEAEPIEPIPAGRRYGRDRSGPH